MSGFLLSSKALLANAVIAISVLFIVTLLRRIFFKDSIRAKNLAKLLFDKTLKESLNYYSFLGALYGVEKKTAKCYFSDSKFMDFIDAGLFYQDHTKTYGDLIIEKSSMNRYTYELEVLRNVSMAAGFTSIMLFQTCYGNHNDTFQQVYQSRLKETAAGKIYKVRLGCYLPKYNKTSAYIITFFKKDKCYICSGTLSDLLQIIYGINKQ